MSDVDTGDAIGRDRPTARLLDPTTAGRGRDGEPPSPTLYLGDRLLVTGYPREARGLQLDEFGDALAKLDLTYRPTERTTRRLEATRSARALALAPSELDSIWASSVIIESRQDPANPPDAWTVLQQLRAGSPEVAVRVGLEHVVRPSGYWGGIGGYWGGIGGSWSGIGYWGGIGEQHEI